MGTPEGSLHPEMFSIQMLSATEDVMAQLRMLPVCRSHIQFRN